jgi:tRNA pseudouridine55 synthase
LVDKPIGWTSHDVVARLRRVLGTKKIGHAGTLDPFASGLLLIAAGKATRLLGYFAELDKVYTATFVLGASSTTDDIDGEISVNVSKPQTAPSANSKEPVSLDEVKVALKKQVGVISQVPSKFSAVKVNGKRAYDLARKGVEFELKPRKVEVYSIDVLGFDTEPTGLIQVRVKICCSSGTYIRAIARDLGEELGIGAYVKELRREKIGEFSLDEMGKDGNRDKAKTACSAGNLPDSGNLDSVGDSVSKSDNTTTSGVLDKQTAPGGNSDRQRTPGNPDNLHASRVLDKADNLHKISLTDAVSEIMPTFYITESEARDVKQGKRIIRPGDLSVYDLSVQEMINYALGWICEPDFKKNAQLNYRLFAAIDSQNELVAIMELVKADFAMHPKKVIG